MSSPMKLVLAGVFAVALVYFLTANSVLQRVSYDIYECDHRTAGKTKLWFKRSKQEKDLNLLGICRANFSRSKTFRTTKSRSQMEMRFSSWIWQT